MDEETHAELTALRISAAKSFETTEAQLEDHDIHMHYISFASGYAKGWGDSSEYEHTRRHSIDRFRADVAIETAERRAAYMGCAFVVVLVLAIMNTAALVYNLFF